MKIEQMKLADVIPYERNPRINDNAIEAVAESIKEFGWHAPIVVDENNIIICGHTRLKAAEHLGLDTVPVHIARGLTPEQIKAYRIADNKTGEIAEWDYELLPLELADLQQSNFDLSLFGFDEGELDMLLNGDDAVADGMTDPDEVPETPEEPISKPGEIYQLGNHRLMCGDATSSDDVKALLSGKTADLWLTDPPYNVAYEGGTGMTIQNDDMDDSAFFNFLASAFTNAVETMNDGASFYIFHADSEGYNFRGACKASGLQVRQCLIWKKNSLVLGRQDYQWIHEPCLYGWKDGAAHSWYSDRTQTTVMEFNRPKRSDLHPCLTPDTLVMTIRGYVPIGEIIKGDLVLSHDGCFHEVTLCSSHSYCENIFNIGVTGTNLEDKATHNHPYLTATRNEHGELDIAWTDAKDLRENDFILTPQLEHGSHRDIGKLDAWCYGLWLAQGSLQKAGHGNNQYPVFALDGRKSHLRKKLEVWGGKSKVKTYRNHSGGHGITVMVFIPEKGERCLELCGKYASQKVISPEVFQWSRELRQCFYEGYMAGDGCIISTRGHRHSKSVSRALASQMKFFAESLGYRTSLYFRQAPVGKGIGKRKFKKTLPFYSSDYHKSKRTFESREVIYGGKKYWLRRIKKVEPQQYDGEVINLSVDGSHTFQTAVGMTHNTMKPIEMLIYLIQNSSQKGNLIVDTFAGSGSTLIAAEQTGRITCLMELDERFCDVIRKRYAEFVHGEGYDWQELIPVLEVITNG